jgi:hypothetical protein
MNQKIINQIVSQKPLVTHDHWFKNKEVETMYSALFNVDSSVGDIDVPDNASLDEIYLILKNDLARRNIQLKYHSLEDGVPHYSYFIETDTEPYMADIGLLNTIIDKSEYLIILCCIFIISKARFNVLECYEWWNDVLEENIEHTEEDEKDMFLAERNLLETINKIHKDYEKLYNSKVLRKLTRVLRQREKYSTKVIDLVERTLEINKNILFLESNNVSLSFTDGDYGNGVYLSYYCGIGLYDDTDDVFEMINQDLQGYSESGELYYSMELNPDNIGLLDTVIMTESSLNSIIWTLNDLILSINKKSQETYNESC